MSAEIKNIKEQRGNWYITLIDPGEFHNAGDISIDVACWAKQRLIIEAQLHQAGLTLTAGMHVRMRGDITVAKTGRIMLNLFELDIEALVGKQASEKKMLYAALEKEGLLNLNRQLPIPLVPLKIGLITSNGSEGYNDFIGQLTKSPYSFQLKFMHSPVQGPTAASLLTRAVKDLQSEDIDLIVMVRGGGGELEAFDKEPIARAIATSRHPVWTGIGHTGDHSVADDVAQKSHITPTACGQAIVQSIDDYLMHISNRIHRVHRAAERQLHNAQNHRRVSIERLMRAVRYVGIRESSNLKRSISTLQTVIPQRIRREQQHLGLLKSRVQIASPTVMLELGYSITRDANGEILRNVQVLTEGQKLITQFHNGTVESVAKKISETKGKDR